MHDRSTMQIKITYRRTSRLSMRISKTGDLLVSAPYQVSKSEVERFIRSNEQWITKAVDVRVARETARKKFYDRLPLVSKEDCQQAAERLAGIIEPLVERYAPLMKVVPNGVRYKKTVSKWGSCNVRTRVLTFSLYLLLLPHNCVEHVVVHELAHLLVPNHSAEFYAVMDKVFPQWREARRETRRIQNAQDCQ